MRFLYIILQAMSSNITIFSPCPDLQKEYARGVLNRFRGGPVKATHSRQIIENIDRVCGLSSSPEMRVLKVRREEAAHKIQKAWRNSRSGIDFVEKDRSLLSSFSFQKFKTVCTKIIPSLRRGSSNLRRQIALTSALCKLQIRRGMEDQFKMPVCDLPKEGKLLPSCQLVDRAELGRYQRLRKGSVFVSPETQQSIDRMNKNVVLTREKLDLLVQALYREHDFIPWDYTYDGCYARAQGTIDFMILSGVPEDRIKKQYAIISPEIRVIVFDEEGEENRWSYHVAPIVKVDDGSQWIIDPVLCCDKALNCQEWVNLQKTHSHICTDTLDLGHLPLNGRKIRKYLFTLTQLSFLFTTDISDYSEVNNEKVTCIVIKALDEESRDWELHKLNEYRYWVENRFIRKLVQ